MAALVFPTSSAPGALPGEGTGRLVNAQAVKDGDEVRWAPVPGLVKAASPGVGGPRGSLLVGGTVLTAREDALFALDGGGTLTRIGRLDGARPVTMARNNRASTPTSAGPDVVVVSEIGAFLVRDGTVVDYPGSVIGTPNSVTFLDARFILSYPTGIIRVTGTEGDRVNSVGLDGNGYTIAESSPDGLLRVTASGGQFFAWGQASVEIFDSIGTPAVFPFARSQVLPVGLLGPWAIAGFETGWDGPQIFVAADGSVRRLDGYTPTRISTRAVERAIAGTTNPALLRACVYTYGGSAIWSLSGLDWTWEHNVVTGEWHERRSTGLRRWRGETSVKAGGRWLIGDTVTGDIVAVSEAERRENGAPLVARIESAPLRNFPDRIRLGALTLDITTGQGDIAGADPIQTDPQCMLSWSVDGGAGFADPLLRPIGGPGRYGNRVSVGDLGRAGREGVRVAIEVSDPVPFTLRGAALPNVSARRGS